MINSLRLTLRPIAQTDAEAIFSYRSDADTNQYQGWVPQTLDEVRQFINRQTAEFNEPDTWYQLAIIRNEDQKLIGDIGIHFVGANNRQAELGCTLHKEFHGNGYAAEAMRAVIHHLFSTLNKHRIFASVDPENTASIRLLERLGFRKEAHHKQSLYFKGKWVDDAVYALLKEDWSD